MIAATPAEPGAAGAASPHRGDLRAENHPTHTGPRRRRSGAARRWRVKRYAASSTGSSFRRAQVSYRWSGISGGMLTAAGNRTGSAAVGNGGCGGMQPRGTCSCGARRRDSSGLPAERRLRRRRVASMSRHKRAATNLSRCFTFVVATERASDLTLDPCRAQSSTAPWIGPMC